MREQISHVENGQSDELGRLRRDVKEKDKRFESSVTSYKEEIRQHSVTICAMEERLNKVVKKNKDYQAEVTQLKKTVAGENSGPSTDSTNTYVLGDMFVA